MDYYGIVGMVVAAIILVGGFYYTVSKNAREEAKPMQELNENLIKLNTNFQNMMEQDKVRDKRLETHGKEIDKMREQQRTNEKILDLHELRIGSLEDKVKGYDE